MSQTLKCIQVALSSPFRRLFDYQVPQNVSTPSIGMRVSIPFGNQKNVLGIVISNNPTSTDIDKLRLINAVLDEEAVISQELIALSQWCADYYHFPLGDVLQLVLPAKVRQVEPLKKNKTVIWKLSDKGKSNTIESLKRAPKQQLALTLLHSQASISQTELKEFNIKQTTLTSLFAKGFITKETVEIDYKKPVDRHQSSVSITNEPPLDLNQEQALALESIDYEKFNTFLLDGITGSGKTEVYLQAIEKVLKQQKQVLVLVPEIGLTPQTLSRFEKRFNCVIRALHSGLTDTQRFTIWQEAKHEQICILIGTRSSIFTPLPNLGLIIIDEEHDLSYKQQEGVRYSARDVAIVRAQRSNIPLILGSATPSLESFHNALSGRYQHLKLRQRANKQSMPNLECIETPDNDLDAQCINAIRDTLAKNQQVLVFINRRGYSPTLICKDCGWISQCEYCDNKMTVHQRGSKRQLHCHACDRHYSAPPKCPKCHSQRLFTLGSGTQKAEESLGLIFKDTPIFRIDRDNMSRKGQLENALNEINSGVACILIGTQMLAKGHHFPNLGLGIILGLDNAFFSSDFRGAERMGQLLTQVSGRIGREKRNSKVLIQTQFSEHPLLQLLLRENYSVFSQQLLTERKLSNMPPIEHITLVRCHAQQPQLAEGFLKHARSLAQKIIPPHNTLHYLGPFPATMEKRNNRYHFLLQIKAANRKERQHLLKHLCAKLEQIKQPRGLHWIIDNDAQEF